MAAAAAEPNGASIEALFRPSTRFRDSNYYRRGRLPEGWTEIELLPHLTPLDILATGVTWHEFLIFLWNKIMWMTPNVYVCVTWMSVEDDPFLLFLSADGGNISLRVHVTPYTADAAATETYDFAVRLLATSEERDLHILGCDDEAPPLSGAALSLFFQESRSSLQKVTLRRMALSEDHCLALATMSRLDVEVTISHCRLTDDAAGAFVECLQSDRGLVNLNWCRIDSQIIANALTGDSRVTRLKPCFVDGTDDAEKAILFRALANNSGLVDLNLGGCSISDNNWSVLCESLQAHPTLTTLGLYATTPRSPAGAEIMLSAEQKALRIRLLAEMMQGHTLLQTITLSEGQYDQQIYQETIQPFLETNIYRPRVLAVKKTKDRSFREKILDRAVYSVRNNPNLVWMLLSENVDAFVRSEEEEEDSNSEEPVVVAAAIVLTVAGSKRKR
jgi:hypothetical protein